MKSPLAWATAIPPSGAGNDLRREIVAVVVRPVAISGTTLRQRRQAGARIDFANLDGCTGAKAGEIVAAAGLSRAICKDVTRTKPANAVEAARDNARPVKPERLCARRTRCRSLVARMPCRRGSPSSARCAVGRNPVRGRNVGRRQHEHPRQSWPPASTARLLPARRLSARDKRDINVFGCGLSLTPSPKHRRSRISASDEHDHFPSCRSRSDGKAPTCGRFWK